MIIQDTVTVSMNAANIRHYESLGYDIPKHLSYNKMVVPRGTTLEVLVNDLPKGCDLKVLCRCDCCGKENKVDYHTLFRVPGGYFCKPCKTIGLNETKKNVPLSEEHKEKLSQRSYMKGKYGSKSPRWDDSLPMKERFRSRRIPGMGKWIREVKERDDYTCQCCGSKDNPCAHHKNNFKYFKEQRTDINNGITLCSDCHKQIHKMFGKKTTEQHLREFLEQSLSNIC